MTSTSDELRNMIAQAQRNNQAAYEHIYHRYVDMVYGYLYACCQNTALAEQALGELWMGVVQQLPNFGIPENGIEQAFTIWLYRIAHNVLVDMMSSYDARLDDSLLVQDDQRRAGAAMRLLAVEQREVMHMRFHEQRSSAEVAVLTGRSEKTVIALQHRALRVLARAMGIDMRP